MRKLGTYKFIVENKYIIVRKVMFGPSKVN